MKSEVFQILHELFLKHFLFDFSVRLKLVFLNLIIFKFFYSIKLIQKISKKHQKNNVEAKNIEFCIP